MADLQDRCAAVARDDETLAGTGPHAARWLLIEDPVAWGRNALADGGLPAPARAALGPALAAHDVRHQAIRRPDRTVRGDRTVMAANLAAGWMARTRVSVDELADLDVGIVAADAAPSGWATVTDPVVLVCTHAKRDACCALWGRPAATDLSARAPRWVWETSHTGGHRFAASIVVLPIGQVHGWVSDTQGLLTAISEHRIDLATYRGNARWPKPVQAAEVAVRRELDLQAPADVHDATLTSLDTDADGLPTGAVVHLVAAGTAMEVTLRTDTTVTPRPLSCGTDPQPLRPWCHTTINLTS